MTKIKITSNPYLQNTFFQRWNETEGSWVDITIDTDPNGNLVKDEIRTCFFPFKVKDIVDTIIEEYDDGINDLELVFEGTDDEFRELKVVCDEPEYENKIKVVKSERYLENARDILPEIREIYKKVEPLITISVIDEKEKLEKEIQKFIDASSDQIPICIMGNYSTGKSTFINALVGSELLPSGDEPVTGKIFKIMNSKQDGMAFVKYYDNEQLIEIQLDEKNSKFVSGEDASPLSKEISELLESCENLTIHERIGKILDKLGKYVWREDSKVDDLIEISVPFTNGIWSKSSNDFVLFDTPGSNSASNIDHAKVLKKAMENMSNGMPIFVSEYNSLDSTDNERLYKDIKSMKELDCRFTMIIVNKADEADLEEEEGKIGLSSARERKLMNMAIPKNMFGEGIFFVSSIMGLGTKLNEQFSDKHYLRVYSRNKPEYADPMEDMYQRLYRYNILPMQLKGKAIEQAEACNDLIYANSGLFSVEKEIQTFGEKYSSYNKCYQSDLFLTKVIDITTNEITKNKENLEISKKNRIDALERDKQELIEVIQKENEKQSDLYVKFFPVFMSTAVQTMKETAYEESLLDEKEEYTKLQKEELNVSDYEEKSNEAIGAVFQNLKLGLKKAITEKSFDSLKKTGETLLDDYTKAHSENTELGDVLNKVKENADDMIIEKKNKDYREYSEQALSIFDQSSKSYWDQKSAEIKKALSQIVTGSEALTDERREKLSNIIINYQTIDFDEVVEDLIEKKKFEKGIFLGGIALWSPGELNLRKLRDFYNDEMNRKIDETYEKVKDSHEQSFKKWLADLEETIIENIVEFNPELHNQNEKIKEETQIIKELEQRQAMINDYKKQISDMMVWKEN